MKRKWTIHYLIALALTGIPSFFILEYARTGKIISPRTGLEIAEGSLAIFIIFVVSSVCIYAWILAVRNHLQYLKDKNLIPNILTPEYVICRSCSQPSYSKDLTSGLCPSCGGDVEELSGYYDRHPERRQP